MSSNVQSRRAFLRRSAFATSLLCLPTQLHAIYESRADAANPVVLRFAALSDAHIKTARDAPEPDRLRRALQFVNEYSASQPYPKCDAILVAGDMADHGLDEEHALFKAILDENLEPATQTLLCMGNHEFISGSKARWEEIYERPANKTYDVNGFKFVALSPEKGTGSKGDYLYALDWYRTELSQAAADGSEKPIFTFQHYHVTPTVYGSRSGRGEDNWGVVDLYDELQHYPRAINFSGHSHFPISDPRSAWQGIFTAFGTGTLSFFEMGGEYGRYDKHPEGYRDAAQLYVVEVRRDNSVTLKPYDVISGSFFDLVYYVANPAALRKEEYTDARFVTSSKPKWSPDGHIVAREIIDAETVQLQFPQATCPDVVHSYRVEIAKQANVDGKIEWQALAPKYFWSKYYLKAQPKIMNVTLEELEPETSYRVKIVALSVFFKESETALETEFTTPKAPPETFDRTAPRPDANFIDFYVRDGDPVNRPSAPNASTPAPQPYGAPAIMREPALDNAYVAQFNGRDQFYKLQFRSSDYRKIKKEATFAATFQFDAFPEGNGNVLANSEGSGVGFEIKGKEQTLEFRASINGRYERVATAITPSSEYYDAFATYDGNELVLYLNGREVARRACQGNIAYPSAETLQVFYVGADVHSDGSGESPFTGRIARARVFTWALSREQVANLYEASKSLLNR